MSKANHMLTTVTVDDTFMDVKALIFVKKRNLS